MRTAFIGPLHKKDHTGDTVTRIARLCARGRKSHVLGPTSNCHGACQRLDRDAHSQNMREQAGWSQLSERNHSSIETVSNSRHAGAHRRCVVQSRTDLSPQRLKEEVVRRVTRHA